jgi:trimeric autotransporter adhesin
MKKKSTSQLVRLDKGGFINLRVVIGLFVVLAGVFLALVGFGAFSSVYAQNGPTRAQMTVAMAQALAIQPPACVAGQEMFHDVPASSPSCAFIEELARRGITGGCGGGNYCPGAPVTRAQMAIFLLKVLGSHDIGIRNVATGFGALFSNTTGEDNTANGYEALSSNTTGSVNTATGVQALFNNTTGFANTATGFDALFSNTEGILNTATGVSALSRNTTGGHNTATGRGALGFNTTGFANTATGLNALNENSTGNNNTATGYRALENNNSNDNTANGYHALFFNTTGNSNTATGYQALFANTTGTLNTATGFRALEHNTTGGSNTAFGDIALFNNTTGLGNVALGPAAGLNQTTGSNNIYIGSSVPGVAGESFSCYISSIFGQTSAGGTGVFINSAGKLGTTTSSRRFKDHIEPMDQASEAILALKPVTFRYKKEIDPQGGPQFGLVAEDVEKVNPALVVRDAHGKVNTVRYDAVNAMLLNEFLKEHRTVQELKSTVAKQETTIAQQQKGIEVLTAQLKEQAAQIQKVSAQVEMNKPAPQMVLNNP